MRLYPIAFSIFGKVSIWYTFMPFVPYKMSQIGHTGHLTISTPKIYLVYQLLMVCKFIELSKYGLFENTCSLALSVLMRLEFFM